MSAMLLDGERHRRDDLLAAAVDVDRRTSTLLKHGRLSDEQHAELQAVYERVRAALCARVTALEWFEPVERRISEVRCELAQHPARHAFETGNAGEALALADEMIEPDPYDESARQCRRYRETLRAELQSDPSRSLAELVGIDPVERPAGAFMHS